mmetsp:Transcript_24784/g.80915  ORF Transcript_24784/g.80915 Transcript_24784/m.80915 type:complete len:239 (+) Transcript_24784:137-853(+)
MNVFDERILPPPESACLRVPLPASHDVLLEEGLAPRDAVKPEAGDVDGLVRAGGQQLGHGPPGPRRLLEPVAGEAVAEHEVVDVRVAPDDGILVERVVLVEARPRGGHLEAAKGLAPLVERRPDDLLEQVMVHGVQRADVVVVWVAARLWRRHAAQELAAPPLGAKVDAGRVHDERRGPARRDPSRLPRPAAASHVEGEDAPLARGDGERGHPGAAQPDQLAGEGPRRVHHLAGANER